MCDEKTKSTLDILNLSAQLKETILLTTIISSLGALVLYYIYPYLLNLFDVVYSEDLDWIVIGLGLNAILGLCIGPVGNILILNDQEKIVLVSECFRSISIIILGFLVISLLDLYTLLCNTLISCKIIYCIEVNKNFDSDFGIYALKTLRAVS